MPTGRRAGGRHAGGRAGGRGPPGGGRAAPAGALSDAPGLLGWDPVQGLAVRDDAGREYEVRALAQQAGLGALQTAAWIEPGAAPRRARAAPGGDRPDAHGRRPRRRRAWSGRWPASPGSLEVDLVPGRTAADPPPEPPGAPPEGGPAGVPARTFGGFRDLVPIGQARMAEGAAVCLWALERYEDRAVLSLGTLADEPAPGGARHPRRRGSSRCGTTAGGATASRRSTARRAPAGARRASRSSPPIDPEARALGRAPRRPALRVRRRRRGGEALAGPFTFGVAVPPAS